MQPPYYPSCSQTSTGTISSLKPMLVFKVNSSIYFYPYWYEGPDGIIVYRIDDGPAFKSVDEILNHYHEVSDRLPCKLTEYCPRPPTRMTEC